MSGLYYVAPYKYYKLCDMILSYDSLINTLKLLTYIVNFKIFKDSNKKLKYYYD